jgi:hypothetical protein
VIAIGKLRTTASARNAHPARNLPTTASSVVTGSVKRSSAVPDRFSSDQSRIPTEGTMKRKSHGKKPKYASRLATPPLKNPPNRENASATETRRNATRNT